MPHIYCKFFLFPSCSLCRLSKTLLACYRVANPDATPASYGFKGSDATRGGGPQDPVADMAYGSGDLTHEPDSVDGGRGVLLTGLRWTRPPLPALSSQRCFPREMWPLLVAVLPRLVTAMVMSSRLSWDTTVSKLQGMSLCLRQWAQFISCYARHRTCCNESGSTWRRGGSASRRGAPSSRSRPLPKSIRWW
jgi:hypothetical protein